MSAFEGDKLTLIVHIECATLIVKPPLLMTNIIILHSESQKVYYRLFHDDSCMICWWCWLMMLLSHLTWAWNMWKITLHQSIKYWLPHGFSSITLRRNSIVFITFFCYNLWFATSLSYCQNNLNKLINKWKP